MAQENPTWGSRVRANLQQNRLRPSPIGPPHIDDLPGTVINGRPPERRQAHRPRHRTRTHSRRTTSPSADWLRLRLFAARSVRPKYGRHSRSCKKSASDAGTCGPSLEGVLRFWATSSYLATILRLLELSRNPLIVAGEQHPIECITMRPGPGGLRPHIDISRRGNLQKAAVVRWPDIWPRWPTSGCAFPFASDMG